MLDFTLQLILINGNGYHQLFHNNLTMLDFAWVHECLLFGKKTNTTINGKADPN